MKRKDLLFVAIGIAIVGVALVVFFALELGRGGENMGRQSIQSFPEAKVDVVSPKIPPVSQEEMLMMEPELTAEDVEYEKSQTVSADTSLDSIDQELKNTNILDEDFSDL